MRVTIAREFALRHEGELAKTANFDRFKGHNSDMPYAIWLGMELDLDFTPTNIFRKYGDDSMKSVRVRERTRPKRPILTDSRAITLTCLMRFG